MSTPPLLSYCHTENKEAPIILYLHGFLGGKEDWDNVILRLGDDFAHLAVDLPGHGGSVNTLSDDDSYSMSGCAQHVIDLLDYLNISRCHVVGYSMGGRLAIYLAAHYPDRFDRFVIESGSPGLKSERERIERVRRDHQLAETIGALSGNPESFENFLNDWYRQPLFETMDSFSPRFQTMINRRLANDAAGLAKSLRLMGTGAQPDLWASLESVMAPMFFVAGSADVKFQRLAALMANLCPGADMAIIAQAGHNVHFEQPAEYCKQIRQFLKR